MQTSESTWGDTDAMYRAVAARDERFDGNFVFGVVTTGIYCRPSCPARTPLRGNVRYFAVPAAAVAGGFRACKRCRPDAVPGGRHWDHRGDLAVRALTLVGAGVVDDGGVAGLARELAVSERHLHRTLVDEVGVGPLALARTRRAQMARLLLDQTELSVTDVAFAAGFASVRQFNDVMREEFGCSPRELRRHAEAPDRPAEVGSITLRLAGREPFDGERLVTFLASRAIPGVESFQGGFVRALSADGQVLVRVNSSETGIVAHLTLTELSNLPNAVRALRRVFDLEADAPAIDEALSSDRKLRRLVRLRPGLRVPGAVSGFEIAVRAVVGQQVSVAGARTLLGRIVAVCGQELASPPVPEVTHSFPTPAALADADLSGLGLTGRRIATLQAVARAVGSGELTLEPGADRSTTRSALLAIPGVGPWTADYIGLRALQDPDAFPAADLVLKRRIGAEHLNPERWRPWRAYAALHIWTDTAEAGS